MRRRQRGSITKISKNQGRFSSPRRLVAQEAPEEGERLLNETRLAKFVRGLRSNPNGLSGPVVVKTLALIFYGLEHGLVPEDLDEHPPREGELREWTAPILYFLGAMNVSYRQTHPAVSGDTAWALAQVGVTAHDLGMELEEFEPVETKRRIEKLVAQLWDTAGDPHERGGELAARASTASPPGLAQG